MSWSAPNRTQPPTTAIAAASSHSRPIAQLPSIHECSNIIAGDRCLDAFEPGVTLHGVPLLLRYRGGWLHRLVGLLCRGGVCAAMLDRVRLVWNTIRIAWMVVLWWELVGGTLGRPT